MFKRRKKYTDQQIIEEILKGNSDQVLRYLYQAVQPKLSHWIIRNNGSEEEAQDIFQDAVLSFYEYVLQGKFDVSKSVDGFIFSIGRNKWINRAKQKSKVVSGADFIENLEIEVEERDLEVKDQDSNKKIEALLTQLGERCKELLTKSIFYNMKMVEIAESMGFKGADAAKTKNYKCKKRLMKLIKEDDSVKGWLYR